MLEAKFFRFLAGRRIVAWRAIGITAALLALFGRSRWDHTLLEAALFALGASLAGAATVGRLWCALYISGRKDSQLVTEGPYSVSRNPLYFFNFLGLLGVGFVTETLLVPAFLAACFLFLYPAVIHQEEVLLRKRFGAAFDAYCDRTPRFLPRWSLRRESVEWTVAPRVYMRNMLDSIWWVLLVALIELAEAARELDLLPTLFVLP